MCWATKLVLFFMVIPLLVIGAVMLFCSYWRWNCEMADRAAARYNKKKEDICTNDYEIIYQGYEP